MSIGFSVIFEKHRMWEHVNIRNFRNLSKEQTIQYTPFDILLVCRYNGLT